ncbi:hypothetical protein FRC08_010598 [Ceratobasidium sp. 394]|nr:hypothetical protein FRC08_010598 [Ceratobasidium sp. 394]KAG9078514.1 hypothetical protein FS749_009450 [Ceratobasidium sp. UAMH 11750]
MFFSKSIVSVVTVAFVAALGVAAERHVVHFDNRCGRGTPTLVQGGRILSTGGDYVSNGPLVAAIAYLQTGNCLLNGENCSTLETTLKNPTCPGCGSSTDVSLIPPHKFSVTTGFGYYGGCDGVGNNCKSASCCPNGAFCTPTDYQSQRQCQANDVNLAITFCL